MAHLSFADAFRRLLGRFHDYHDAPRDPESMPELASARFALEDARTDAKIARDTHHVDPPTPDYVEPGLGTDSRSTVGKVAAGLFVVIAVAGFLFAVNLLSSFNDPDVEVVEGTWSESIVINENGACLWVVRAELRNTTDEVIVFGRATADTNYGRIASTSDAISLEPNAVTPVVVPMVFTPTATATCPDSADELVVGGLRVNNDFSLSRG